MNFQVSLGFHIIGIVLWIGGLMVTAGLIRYFEKTDGARNGPAYAALTKRYFYAMTLPGLVIALCSGTYQLLTNGISFYMQQGWFHGKLTLVLILFVVTLMVGLGVARVQRGDAVNGKKFGAMHGVIGTIFLLIIFLTYIGRA